MEKSTFCKKRSFVLIVFILLIFSSSTVLNIVNASVDEQTPNITTNTTWWDTNWNFRQLVILFNPYDELNDYQMLLELPVADYSDNTQSDGADIRFVLDDHSTVLDHWIEEWDESGTINKVWVKTDIDNPVITGGFIGRFYIYYGNPDADSTSNGKNTFAFFEDFSGTELDTINTWTVSEYTSGTHNLEVDNGELHVYAESATVANSGYYLRTNDVFSLTNFAMHAEARVENMDWERGCNWIGDVYLKDDDNHRTGLGVAAYGDYQLTRFQYTDGSFTKSRTTPNTGTGNITTDYKVMGNSWDMDISSGTWSMTYNPTISTFSRPFCLELYALVQYWTNFVKMDVYYDIIYLRNYDDSITEIQINDEETIEQLDTVDILDAFIYDDGTGLVFDKGEKVQIFVIVKNNLDVTKTITSISWAVQSVLALGTSKPYSNATGFTPGDGIILEGENTYSKTLLPGDSYGFSIFIDYQGYSNGAMNIGFWELRFVKIRDSDGAIVVGDVVLDRFKVDDKTDPNDGSHPIFIYYLWNSGGRGETFEGDDPKNYFEDGWGIHKAGFFRFEDLDFVPYKFKMTICYNDPTWDIPATGYENILSIKSHGEAKVAQDLNLFDGMWKKSDYTHVKNCGFDVLMMGAARYFSGLDARMGTSEDHTYCFLKAGASTYPFQFKVNIDGCVQHQFSNFFEALQSDQHGAFTYCINNWYLPLLNDYLHELNAYRLIYNPQATSSFCDACYQKIEDNWDWFYEIKSS